MTTSLVVDCILGLNITSLQKNALAAAICNATPEPPKCPACANPRVWCLYPSYVERIQNILGYIQNRKGCQNRKDALSWMTSSQLNPEAMKVLCRPITYDLRKLPAEIRNRIYELLLPQGEERVDINSHRSLFQVCKQIRNEALPLYIGNNTFSASLRTLPGKFSDAFRILNWLDGVNGTYPSVARRYLHIFCEENGFLQLNILLSGLVCRGLPVSCITWGVQLNLTREIMKDDVTIRPVEAIKALSRRGQFMTYTLEPLLKAYNLLQESYFPTSAEVLKRIITKGKASTPAVDLPKELNEIVRDAEFHVSIRCHSNASKAIEGVGDLYRIGHDPKRQIQLDAALTTPDISAHPLYEQDGIFLVPKLAHLAFDEMKFVFSIISMRPRIQPIACGAANVYLDSEYDSDSTDETDS
jgi:hypothetical protein